MEIKQKEYNLREIRQLKVITTDNEELIAPRILGDGKDIKDNELEQQCWKVVNALTDLLYLLDGLEEIVIEHFGDEVLDNVRFRIKVEGIPD